MQRTYRFLGVVIAAYLAAAFTAAAAHTQARLLLGADHARPGETVLAGIRLEMEPGWHTYWRNSGASGLPTKVDWQLPAGVTSGEPLWPVPRKTAEQDLTTYIYEQEVVLLVPLRLATNVPAGPLELKAKVSWLECELQCVPGSEVVRASLVVGPETTPSASASTLAAWQQRLPQAPDGIAARAWWGGAPQGDSRPLLLEWNSRSAVTQADFFPDASDLFEVQPATERLTSETGTIRLRKEVKKISGDWPKELTGVLVQSAGDRESGYEVKLPIGTMDAAASAPPPGSATPPNIKTPSLGGMLLYAFLGGMILNIMPCVLPVIALKILGFVGQSRAEPRQVRVLGLTYALGVLVSFAVLAALVIGVKAAGHQAGWGMQFGNPQFLVILTVLVTLVALNLFGLFEVSLSGRVMGTAGELAAKHGLAGAFFNGVLATVLATPCTAPFLGAALGFAFVQPPITIVIIFLTVGLGLALPYVALSWQPSWLQFVPKPGPWMERFKIALGFPMLATVFWLLSLLPIHYGERAWWLGIFLVMVALSAWVFGQFWQRSSSGRGWGLALTLVLLAIGYLTVLEGQLRWRKPESPTASGNSLQMESGGLPWQPWSPEAITTAQAAGRPVLVDFTAKWCLTCNTVVKPALESAAVRQRLQQLHVVALLADCTRFPENLTRELNRFGRAGVPLVLVYSKDPAVAPIVLPEAITPGMVLSALEQATKANGAK